MEQSAQYTKRNYFLFFMDSVLFSNGATFISINTVIPYFLSSLGADTLYISIANALVSIAMMLSQPFFSKKAMTLPRKLGFFTKVLSVQRFFFLAYALTLPLTSKFLPGVMVPLFLIVWGIFNLCAGSYSAFFGALLSKFVRDNERGRLIGFAAAAGNTLAVLSSIAVGWLLAVLQFPYNYTVIFATGCIIFLLDALVFRLMRNEPEDPPHEGAPMGFFQYLRHIPELLRGNRKFAVTVVGYCMVMIANVANSYYSLYAIREFHAGATEIGIFTAISVLGSVLSFSVFGIVADRYGCRVVMCLAAVCGFLGLVIVLLFKGIAAAYVGYALATVFIGAYNLTCSLYILQQVDKKRQPLFLSANVMITLFVSSVVTILSGLMIDRFSFTPVFLMALIATIFIFVIFFFIDRFAKNPPSGQGADQG